MCQAETRIVQHRHGKNGRAGDAETVFDLDLCKCECCYDHDERYWGGYSVFDVSYREAGIESMGWARSTELLRH